MDVNADKSRTSWLASSARVLLFIALLGCLYFVATRAVAAWYFRRETLDGYRRALRWDPRNPLYAATLARALEFSGDASAAAEIIPLHERATRLAPRQASYWAGLGSAYESAGRIEDARRAYEHAAELFPNSPDINWRLGNFYLRNGRIPDALDRLRGAILADSAMRRPAFDLSWRALDDGGLILEHLVPSDKDNLFAYLDFLTQSQRTSEAVRVWDRILRQRFSFEPRAAFPFLDALIRDHRLDDLASAWEQLADRDPAAVHPSRTENNLVANGGFEDEILNGGLGWRVETVEGAVVETDSRIFAQGAQSLAVHFDGQRNLDYGRIFQYILVRPDTDYRFTAQLRVEAMTTDSGVRFQLQDAYDPAQLSVMTPDRIGTSSWLTEELRFRTGPQTRLLLLRLLRLPSDKFDNKISGTAWIDAVTLAAAPPAGSDGRSSR